PGGGGVVVLRKADGTPCARPPYPAGGVPAGVPIELTPDGWRASSDPDGPPLRPPRPPVAIRGRFQIAPVRVHEGGSRVRLAWSLPWEKARARVEVYDLAGDRVGLAMPEVTVTAHGEHA